MLNPDAISRRSFLRNSFAAVAIAVLPQDSQPVGSDHGAVKPPRPLPDLNVLCQNGKSGTLQSFASNRVTALQLMFTTCTTTCPMQGAIFERVQKQLPDMAKRGMQLISLSVDPKNDTPQALSEWLSMFHAGPDWIGASPAMNDLAKEKSFFGVGRNELDPHTTQIYIIDRSGRVVWRTFELPPPEEIASILRRV